MTEVKTSAVCATVCCAKDLNFFFQNLIEQKLELDKKVLFESSIGLPEVFISDWLLSEDVNNSYFELKLN